MRFRRRYFQLWVLYGILGAKNTPAFLYLDRICMYKTASFTLDVSGFL